MKLILQRYSDNGDDTLGLLFEVVSNELVFRSYSIEDENRAVKIKGETCIPARLYSVKQNKVDTPLTLKYRNKFSWFDYHLEIQDVEGFDNIYIHIGNSDGDTQGCVLLGDAANNNMLEGGFISSSTKAFKRLYHELREELRKPDGRVWLEIRDVEEIL